MSVEATRTTPTGATVTTFGVWERWAYESGETVWQRLCTACDKGLLLAPARFCGTCNGHGTRAWFQTDQPDDEGPDSSRFVGGWDVEDLARQKRETADRKLRQAYDAAEAALADVPDGDARRYLVEALHGLADSRRAVSSLPPSFPHLSDYEDDEETS